jgi:hypothetical protein
MNTTVLSLTLACLSFSLFVKAESIENKVQLENVVANYEDVAEKASSCKASNDVKSTSCKGFIEVFNSGAVNQQLKSFGANISRYLSIEPKVTMRGVRATGTIMDTITFIWNEQSK